MTLHTPIPAADLIQGLVQSQPPAHSLHRDLYNSPEAFAHDMDRVFGRSWVLAGHAGQAPNPGDWFTVTLAQESIVIVRGQDSVLRAFANVCRHRGSRICTGAEGNARVLVCPYHAWTYTLDGGLRSARYMGPDFDRTRYGLKPVAIEVIEGLIFITLAETPLNMDRARALIEGAYGPYGWGTASVAHRETCHVTANWKLAVENYLECYHCAPAHPEYSKLHALEKPLDQIEGMNASMEARTCALGLHVAAGDHRVGSATGEQGIFTFRYALHDGVRTGGPEGAPVAPLMGGFNDYDGGVTSTHMAPSSFFIAYPDHGVIYRFIPLTPATSAMELIWLVKGGAEAGRDYDRDALTWLWRVTTEADKRITEDNQKGVNSRFYEPGPYSPAEPNAIRWVNWYLGEIA